MQLARLTKHAFVHVQKYFLAVYRVVQTTQVDELIWYVEVESQTKAYHTLFQSKTKIGNKQYTFISKCKTYKTQLII